MRVPTKTTASDWNIPPPLSITRTWNKIEDGSPRGPKDDLAAAEKLINECGYHRRDQELADAKQAILA